MARRNGEQGTGQSLPVTAGRAAGLATAPAPSVLDGQDTHFVRLAELAFQDSVDAAQRILAVAREQLDMDVAFIGELTPSQEIFRAVDGDAASFGLAVDKGVPLEQTFCRRMVAGLIPSVINDAGSDERVSDLAGSGQAGIGTYVGVPLVFSNGRLYGTLCCLSHAPNASTGDRDVRFMRVLARLLAEQLERHDVEWKRRNLRVQRIRRILAGGPLPMAFQPIFDLQRGRVVGVEALARFPSRHLPTPDRWFAEAAAVGLGTDLELLAISSALAALPSLPTETYLSVNVSARTLATSRLRRALQNVPAERLVLEVTEHDPVDDYQKLNQAADRLRDRGAGLAVDDVGAGFASLRHILRLAPDIIKLDIALTRDIHTDPIRRAMAGSLISFAAETGAAIVAEGIETREELETLKGLGVGLGQGFWLARPARIDELALAV